MIAEIKKNAYNIAIVFAIAIFVSIVIFGK